MVDFHRVKLKITYTHSQLRGAIAITNKVTVTKEELKLALKHVKNAKAQIENLLLDYED
jgi:hypothetical protein